jgi:hypothetical protein
LLIPTDDSDIFSIFTRIITDDMSKDDLRTRVIELEAKNEKLHETLAKIKSIQDETAKDLSDTHRELAKQREENQLMKVQLRQLQAQMAFTTV